MNDATVLRVAQWIKELYIRTYVSANMRARIGTY